MYAHGKVLCRVLLYTTFHLLRRPEINGGVRKVNDLSLNFDRQPPMPLFLRLFKVTRKRKVVTENKIDNPRFVYKETIPLVQDEDYDD